MSEEYKSKPEEDGGMKIGLLDLLWPVLPFLPFLPVKGTIWLSQKLKSTAREEVTDKASIQEELLELQMRYEIGEIDDEEYAQQEAQLMDRLEAARKLEEQE